MGIGILKRLINYKSICGFCGVLSMIALAVAVGNPNVGYELSIYVSTPLAVWVIIIFNIAISVVLLAMEASQNKPNRRWLLALSILVVNGVIVLSLSILRGYFAIGRDTLMHIGYVSDLANGIVSKQNGYPMVHMLPSFFVKLGISPSIATSLSPVFWYLLYMASFYGLARIIWQDRRNVIIATTLSAMLLLPIGVGLAATLVGAAIFPLTILVLFKMREGFRIKHVAIFLVLLFVISLLHPLALEATFISLLVACAVFTKNRWKLVGLVCILLPIALWWCGYWWHINVPISISKDITKSAVAPNSSMASPIQPLPRQDVLPPQITDEQDESLQVLPSVSGIESTQTVSNFSGLSLIGRRYGGEILIGFLAGLSLVVLARKFLWKNAVYMYFGILFVLFNMMWLAGWYLQLIAYSSALERMLNWVPIVSIPLVTPLIMRLLNTNKLRKLSVVAIVCVLLVVSGSSLFNRYPSPIIGVDSPHITNEEIIGVSWLINNGNPNIPIINLNTQRISRYVAAIYGVQWVRDRQIYYWLPELKYSRTFNYNDYDSIGDAYPEDVYVIVTKLDRVLPRWGDDKMWMLQSDTAATLIYKDRDEFEVWSVKSRQEGNK